jgi:hypothetical protein
MRGGQRYGAGRPRGAKNKRAAAVEAAMQVVAAKFRDEIPEAFDGDGVAYLQTVYRDPALPVDVRIDAAAKSARYERPALAATLTRGLTPEDRLCTNSPSTTPCSSRTSWCSCVR